MSLFFHFFRWTIIDVKSCEILFVERLCILHKVLFVYCYSEPVFVVFQCKISSPKPPNHQIYLTPPQSMHHAQEHPQICCTV